ncbi:hypothetical protein Q7P37_009635 [Cladosporium fusiforme]
MAANRNSRYYSQSYEAVDNPAQPYVSRPESSTFQDYQDYQGYKTVSDLDISEPLPPRSEKAPWSRRKIYIIAGAVAACVIIGLAVGLGVGLTQRNKDEPYTYVPVKGDLQVTNDAAFGHGATREDPDKDDGIGAGTDEYTYYSGNASAFPDPKDWVSFEDMWAGNIHFFRTSCHANGHGKDQTETEIGYIHEAIQNRAAASLVDHRYILATILQETHGCAKVKSTTSYGGVKNPGLMQSNDGAEWNSHHANQSIFDMVQDGVQGTATGDGLVMGLDYFNNTYSAARYYNSGLIPKSGNLSEAAGATACYVSDLANRLTGWANATTKCHEPEE